MKQKLLLCSLVILCVGFGFAEEAGKFGFLFKSSSIHSVGLSFNLTDRVTLRPSFGFSTNKNEYESQNSADTKNNLYSVDLGLFYHFLKKDRFTAYSGLEVGYSHQKFEREISGVVIQDSVEKKSGYMGNAIIGLQYNFNKHLAVFGEVAFGYQKTEYEYNEPIIISYPAESITWGLSRSGFGIILYL